MSKAEEDIRKVVDRCDKVAKPDWPPATLAMMMMSGFLTLILERLDAIENELRFGNNKGVR